MAKFEQMITQDEYYACIKGCQIIDCVARNKDYFHFVGRNVKEEGAQCRSGKSPNARPSL